MITFIVSIACLVLGYFIYGKIVEKVFHPDSRPTPAVSMADGVDFIAMPSWKVFMIQFLNIAGTGPIFGAIMGMWYGPAAYLWIVLGCIFAGAVHDYLSGMISIRHGGVGLPEIIGIYLGKRTKHLMLAFSGLMLIMVGAVFVLTPATLLAGLMKDAISLPVWIGIIFAYYVLATMMPVDKIIGKIYPVFAIAIIFMGLALMVSIFIKQPVLPEIWEGIGDWSPRLGIKKMDPVFPALCITIACGAISGFHATQSPMMARCVKSEKMGRPIFYGSMIMEGIIAMIWATVSAWFFFEDGWMQVCPHDLVVQFYGQEEKTLTQFFSAPSVVMNVCNGWLGTVGGILAILGVVAAPITTGDTAFRSARLIVADWLKMDQRPILKRLYISIPLFASALALLLWQLDNPDSFNVIWKYFGWSNQTLAVFTLWMCTVYLVKKRGPYIMTLIPALFITEVSVMFLCISKQALNLGEQVTYIIGGVVLVVSLVWFFLWNRKEKTKTSLPCQPQSGH